jgi:hypothetical protein
MSRRHRRIAIVGAVAVLAGTVAGATVAGSFVWSENAERLDSALVDATPVQVAEIPADTGLPARGVFAQLTSTGHLCISDAPVDSPLTGGGGCNSAEDPLGGKAISASLAYEGGPATTEVKDARMIGLAESEVATVRILMSDGTFRSVKLKKAKVGADEFKAFGYRFKKADLRKGIGPTAIVAFDASGAELGRQPTGIG